MLKCSQVCSCTYLVLCSHSCTDSARFSAQLSAWSVLALYFSLSAGPLSARAIALSVPWPKNWWAAALGPVSLLFNLGALGTGQVKVKKGSCKALGRVEVSVRPYCPEPTASSLPQTPLCSPRKGGTMPGMACSSPSTLTVSHYGHWAWCRAAEGRGPRVGRQQVGKHRPRAPACSSSQNTDSRTQPSDLVLIPLTFHFQIKQ